MISVKNLSKRFDEAKVLEDLFFDIKNGEIVGLLGPNGAGKTTTMRILTGFLSADKGKIIIDDKDFDDDKNIENIKKKIGYLPEDNPLYQEMTVEEYLSTMAELKQIERSKIKNEIKKVVAKTGLDVVYYKQISDLSKGFKQRVGLAASILNDPEILILDEPTEGLDPQQRIDIRNLIKSLGENKTVIISSHVLSEIENTCDRIIIINKGKVVADGQTRDIVKNTEGKNELILEVEGKDVCRKLKEFLESVNIKVVDISEQKERIRIVVEIKQNQEVRPEIFKLAKESGWIIWEMHLKEMNLEDVFRKLTSDK